MKGTDLIPERAGTRFVVNALSQVPARLVVIDTADASHPGTILEHLESGSLYYGSTPAITLDPQYVIWSRAKYGATAIPLP